MYLAILQESGGGHTFVGRRPLECISFDVNHWIHQPSRAGAHGTMDDDGVYHTLGTRPAEFPKAFFLWLADACANKNGIARLASILTISQLSTICFNPKRTLIPSLPTAPLPYC